MKALHEKVNIVPVLAKADTLTPLEVKKKKIKASAQAVELCVFVYGPWAYFSYLCSDSRGDRTVRDKDLPVSRL